MELEKRKRFIVNFLYFSILLGAAVVLSRYALGVLAPFLAALVVSLLLKPAVAFLREKCRLHKNLAGVLVVLLFYALIVFLLVVLGVQIFTAAKTFFLRLPALYANTIAPWLSGAFAGLRSFVEKLDPETAAAYNLVASNVTQTLGQSVASASKAVVSWVTGITLKAPGFLLHLLIAVIATFFLSIDLPKIKAFLLLQFSEKNRDLLHNVRVHLSRTLWRYTRSYALILLITFIELALGLSVVGVKGAIGIAAAIAVFDILPVVGSGLVLLPWTIVSVLSGDYMRALGLGVLYVVVIVVRNVMEPKIGGDRVGLHPLVTLLSMVLGVFLFGGVGLLGLPIALALAQSLNKEGVVHLYRTAEGAPSSASAASSAASPAEPSASKNERRARKRR